jgi:hypothetical protein
MFSGAVSAKAQVNIMKSPYTNEAIIIFHGFLLLKPKGIFDGLGFVISFFLKYKNAIRQPRYGSSIPVASHKYGLAPYF